METVTRHVLVMEMLPVRVLKLTLPKMILFDGKVHKISSFVVLPCLLIRKNDRETK